MEVDVGHCVEILLSFLFWLPPNLLRMARSVGKVKDLRTAVFPRLAVTVLESRVDNIIINQTLPSITQLTEH